MPYKDPEADREYHRRYQAAHKEAHNEAMWRFNRTEKRRAYMREYVKKWREENPEKVKSYYIDPQASARCQRRHAERYAAKKREKRYGITDEQYAALLNAQSGACAICHNPCSQRLAVDHAHVDDCRTKTRKNNSCPCPVRGLLCRRCNASLVRHRKRPFTPEQRAYLAA